MNTSSFPFLTVLTFTPLLGALLVMFLPAAQSRAMKVVTLLASLGSLLLAICITAQFQPNIGMQFVETAGWIPSLNVDYHLGVDGLSITMVLLTAVITPLALLAHWKLDKDVRLFCVLFLFLETGMLGLNQGIVSNRRGQF